MSRREETFDIAIVGGGAMGCATAFHLKRLDPGLSIVVIERDPTYATASSARSLGSIRQQFSAPVNMALSRLGFEFLREAGRLLAVDGLEPDVALRERGYLYLATPEGAGALREKHATQRACGADIALLPAADLAARYPWLATGDLALGRLGLRGEGWFDGEGLLHALRRKARSLGVVFLAGEAQALRLAPSKVLGIDVMACCDRDGGAALTRIACAAVVNAAGPHAADVARMAGIDLPVVPLRQCVFVLECPQRLAGMPLVIDPGGTWFRPEGTRYLAGAPPREAESPANRTLDVDHALFEDTIWPALAHRVPAFEALRVTSAWAGFYEMNTFDQNAIIGRAPGLDNLYLINGFSGHGLQQAPAAGLALAELIVHGVYRTLDVSVLGFDRIAAARPVREANVI
ncbi:MAG TPA: FAD-dependent oxidoreductase [Burkholderiaceae bacterium]|nr:FAD-dependent oxidoreductase [Burkholderiaceae bacterium]